MNNALTLLAGNPIWVDGIGYIRSPKLKSLTTNDAHTRYALFCNILYMTTAKDVIEMASILELTAEFDDLTDLDRDEMTAYELLTHSPSCRSLLLSAIAYFLTEDESVAYHKSDDCFTVYACDLNGSMEPRAIGKITSTNFGDMTNGVKQALHQTATTGKEKYASTAAKEWWETATQKESSQTANSKDFEMHNIISKLCVAGIGYTLHNIFELTVYQLYDQFDNYNHLRLANLSENAYAHNGGDQFDFATWYKNNY